MPIPLGVVTSTAQFFGSYTVNLSFDRLTFGCYEDEEEGFEFEELTLPTSEDNWYEDQGDASALDSSPDSCLLSPLALLWMRVPPLPQW